MRKLLKAFVVLFIFSFIIMLLFFIVRDNNKNNNNESDYVLLENSNLKYKYISSYEDYMNFMDTEEITKNDYYKAYSLEDFKNQTYLFLVMPYDECGEEFVDDKVEKNNNKYNVYLDMKYKCGVCAPSKRVLAYEVDKEDLDVKVYTKTISRESCDPNVAYKPIIYIYPTSDIDLKVTLGNKDNLLYTYPKYNDSWNVHVSIDGNIYDYNTKRNYYGLYWEGIDNHKLDLTTGFVVKGSDTVSFLEEKLAILGLNDYEINEFIIYWIDKLESNKYNFISFRNIDEIEKSMPLNFSIKPDTLIRIMMDFKPLDNYINVNEQQLNKVERKGFTVVEWGGTKY